MFGKKVHEQNILEEGHYYISISDLMTSLLFIFILILSYVMLSFVKKEKILNENIKKIEQNIKSRAQLLEELKTELVLKNIDVKIDSKNGNMRLKSDLLFKQGSALISKDGQYQIGEIAKIIVQKMENKNYKDAIDTIFIEGHTDSLPMKTLNICRTQWTNKELSAQRAINTYTEMVKVTNAKIKSIKNKKGKHLISYSGYADNRPICKEVSTMTKKELKICRAKNRRIEFYFTVNTPEIKKLQEL